MKLKEEVMKKIGRYAPEENVRKALRKRAKNDAVVSEGVVPYGESGLYYISFGTNRNLTKEEKQELRDSVGGIRIDFETIGDIVAT